MNTHSHILMGRFLHDYVRKRYGIVLNRRCFIWGNVLPDYSVSFIQRPHFIKYNLTYVQKLTVFALKQAQKQKKQPRKSANRDKNYSKQLGILCHYYADFFCFAHTSHFKGGLYQHIKYEDKLGQFFDEKYDTLATVELIHATAAAKDEKQIFAQFNKLQSAYMESAPSFQNDMTYSILACAELICLLTGSSARAAEVKAEEPLRAYSVATKSV